MSEAARSRSGSMMSSKQLAYAAVHGRRLTFRFQNQALDVSGYLVGMDDYHWNVAVVSSQNSVATVLVHKGAAALVHVGRENSLASEPDEIRDSVEKIGSTFFNHCKTAWLGKQPSQA